MLTCGRGSEWLRFSFSKMARLMLISQLLFGLRFFKWPIWRIDYFLQKKGQVGLNCSYWIDGICSDYDCYSCWILSYLMISLKCFVAGFKYQYGADFGLNLMLRVYLLDFFVHWGGCRWFVKANFDHWIWILHYHWDVNYANRLAAK